MSIDGNRAGFITAGRMRILEEISAHGPLTMPEIPRRWPFTRELLEAMVRELVAAGVLRVVRTRKIGGQRAYDLTPEGRVVLASGQAWTGPLPAAS